MWNKIPKSFGLFVASCSAASVAALFIASSITMIPLLVVILVAGGLVGLVPFPRESLTFGTILGILIGALLGSVSQMQEVSWIAVVSAWSFWFAYISGMDPSTAGGIVRATVEWGIVMALVVFVGYLGGLIVRKI